MSVLYQNSGPDAALWITVPAAGLTAILVNRMLRNPSIGYWVVPNWGVPVHAITTAALLTAVSINALQVSRALYLESRPFGYHVLTNATSGPQSAAKIGTFDEGRAENTFELYVAEASTSVTIQLKRIDGNVDPVLRIETEDGQLVLPTTAYETGRRGLVIDNLQLEGPQRYMIKVARADASTSRGQFVVLTHNPSSTSSETLSMNFLLDFPELWTLSRALRNQNLPVMMVLIAIVLMVLILIAYFLAGSIWGSRAAWRGLGFGFLLYFTIYGLGLGWQASVVYADNPRELWQPDPTNAHITRMVDTLEEMSRHGTGLKREISISVQAPNDSPLAWALRNFSNVEYVNGVGVETETQAIIVPFDQRDQVPGADYVGQDFIVGERWQIGDLAWLDLVAWLSVRETRFPSQTDDHYMLWIRNDVYGVREVNGTESSQ